MKLLFAKIGHWIVENFDSIEDIKHAFYLVMFSVISIAPTLELLTSYGLSIEFGIFAIFGQCIIYIARFLYPEWFPKQPEYTKSKWILRFISNVIMAGTFGMFLTPMVANYLGQKDLSIVAVSAGVGAFYELVLKRIIKFAYKLSSKTEKE
jgi:hypothetical protein